MNVRKRSPVDQWEKELIDDFQDYQWRLVLNPLYEKFQRWKAGGISHLELGEVIHKTHRQCQENGLQQKTCQLEGAFPFSFHAPSS